MAEKMKVPRGVRVKNKDVDAKKVFFRLLKYLGKSYGIALGVVLVCIILNVYANIRGTLFLQTLIDSYILPLLGNKNPDFDPLKMAIFRVACIYALGITALFLQSKIMVIVTQGTLKRLRIDMFSHMESLPIKYFDTNPHGDIMSVYTNDIDTLRQMISQSLPQLISSAITLVGVFISMLILNLPLTLLTLAMVGVMMFVSQKIAGLSGRFFVEQQIDIGKVNGYIEELMEGQKVVKVFCHEEASIKDFQERNNKLFDSADKANTFANILMPINAQLGNVSYVLCAIIGGILALGARGGFTLGALASFLTFNKSLNQPISQVSQQLNALVMAMAGAQRIFKILDEEKESDEGYVTLVNVREEKDGLKESKERTNLWAWKHYHANSKTTDYQRLKGLVEFENVDFGYNDDKMVLKNINLYAYAGQKIAFVGSTGAGKTTITNLINRFYDIQKGKIRYDGINIHKIKKADLRKSLGIVLQDTHLFTATVMENIRYGRLDAGDEDVYRAAKLANADTFIKHLPDGYHTLLTGDGANLSQGQRQLLAIARAAIADPPVLILDEATSSIDTRTEKIVQDGMDKLMEGRTTFVIAHRLSTIQNSDCIMVLENGEIIERGNHEELMKKKSRYYELYTGNGISAS